MPLNTSTTYHAPPPSCNFFCQHTYRKNVYCDEGVILSHICWGPGGPLPFSRPQTPPPPPPELELAGKWEGVGVWPVATPPPCCRLYLTPNMTHTGLHGGEIVSLLAERNPHEPRGDLFGLEESSLAKRNLQWSRSILICLEDSSIARRLLPSGTFLLYSAIFGETRLHATRRIKNILPQAQAKHSECWLPPPPFPSCL